MMTFTTVFMLLTSPIMIKQFPPILGCVRVAIIVVGIYIFNIYKIKEGFLSSLIRLGKEKETRYMLIAAFIYSIK